MKQFILNFIREEEGQDLVEYTLLLAFVCLASAALFINAGTSLATIWTDTNIIASRAASSANAVAS
jgi:Flp pilus assembly pilin Flp